MAGPAAAVLPPLRSDLAYADGGYDGSGEPGVVLHDPVRHRYFRLTQRYADILKNWQGGTPAEVAAATGLDETELKDVAEFLVSSRLVETAAVDSLLKERERVVHSPMMQVVHGYLMFRIPIFNPEPFLDWALPLVRPLASRAVFWVLFMCAVVGLFFAGQQWDHFISTFSAFLSLEGAGLFGVTLLVLKVFHEMGHGFVARHFGCRVPIMGVSFMVLAPMLYTEASDAWRLASRRQRFLIGAAGVLVELGIAAVALLLWAFLPDGALRSICFFVAVTAWIMSVAVNLSPFMRFDGYHMLVDATGLHSIGPRAFKLANWALRDLLFKPNEPLPEILPRNMFRALIMFAWGTWIYRLGLFLGIAWLVYTMLPKAVGAPMAVVEVWFFILKPIVRELKEWKNMEDLFGTKRSKLTLALCTGLIVLSALPLQRSVSVPAVLLPQAEFRAYAPEPSEVIEMEAEAGQVVKRDQVLARLNVPELAHLQRLAATRLAIVEFQLKRLTVDARDLAQSQVLKREQAALQEELSGLRQRSERLVVRAGMDGVVAGQATRPRAGQWVGRDALLFHIVADAGAQVTGLVLERDAVRLKVGGLARFVGEDGLSASLPAEISALQLPGAEGVALGYLSSSHGGAIAMVPGQNGEKPLEGQIPVTFAVEGEAPAQARVGTIVVSAEPQSLLGFALARVVTVFLRESGF